MTGPGTRTTDELRVVAERAGEELEHASAEKIITWAVDTFGDRFCVTSSMADAVVIDLAARVRPGVSVVFLDTGYHFAETIGTRDAVAAGYAITLVTATPKQSVAEQDASYGKDLFARDPDRCCALRKVAPLDAALAHYDAWATGLRRDESPTRADTKVVSFDERRGKVKLAPLARWTAEDVDAYIVAHEVLRNPLLSDGYLSIGCAPCTQRVQAGADTRAGRWAGTGKTECGLHR